MCSLGLHRDPGLPARPPGLQVNWSGLGHANPLFSQRGDPWPCVGMGLPGAPLLGQLDKSGWRKGAFPSVLVLAVWGLQLSLPFLEEGEGGAGWRCLK